MPKELTHFHGWFPNEITEDLYQIVYGLFKHCLCLYDVYKHVGSIANRQQVPALRKFKLNSWKKSLKSMVKSLETNNSKDYRIIINIPLVVREMSLSEAIDYFQMAIITLDEFLDYNVCPVEDFQNSFKAVPNIKQLFEETFSFLTDSTVNAFNENEEENEESGIRRLAAAVFKDFYVKDEMYRRGIDSICVNGEEIKITPSEFYNEPNRYKETFIEKDKTYEVGLDDIEYRPLVSQATDSFDPSSEFVRTRATVMYHMLSSFVPITKENKYKVIALFNYAIGKIYNFKLPKQETRDNSVRKYVDDCIANRLPPANSLDFCISVKKRLIEYGFDVPAIIEDGTETKKPKKLI
jgi:hypothetical protein